MKKIIILIYLISIKTYAYFDQHLSAAYRSFPQSGTLNGTIGYNKLLWREDDVLYGYFRPNINISSVGLFNAFKGEMQLFPISFFMLSTGYELMKNNSRYADNECDKYACQITIRRNYIRTRLLAAYKNYFGLVNYERSYFYTPKISNNQLFIEPTSQLPTKSSNDVMDTITLVTGKNLTKNYKLILISINGHTRDSDKAYNLNTINISYEKDKMQIITGIGTYKSSIHETHTALLFATNWTFKKDLGL